MRRPVVAIPVSLLCLAGILRAQCPDGAPPPCANGQVTAARTVNPFSIAVLYFDNLSRDAADEYIADGLTEQLIVRLGRIARLDVRLRSEVQRYHGRPLTDPAAIARALNVRYLLTGSVRKVGQRVVVTAELSQPLGRPSRVWGDVMDRSGADVLDVETAIAEAVASVVAGRLQPDERAAVTRRPTRDARAYDLFQQANLYFNRGMVAGAAADLRSAVAFYRAAIERDSGFVAAWEGLAWTWWWLAGTAPTHPALLEVRQAAERAMVLDSTAGNAMGMDAIAVAGLAYDWPAAVELARRGTRAAPRAAGPWITLSLLLDYQGRFAEAVAAGDSALARDSVAQASHWALAVPLIDSRRWEQLAGWESRWRSSDPIVATYARTYLALHEGRPLDALHAYRALPYDDLNALVEALVAADSLTAARDLVSRARAQAETQMRDAGWVTNPDGLAAAYALLGEVDTAFVWLERAYTQGNMDLLLRLKVCPSFDRLRNDPRYHDLLRRMHLEP